MTTRIGWLLVALAVCEPASAENRTTARAFVIEPTTLVSAGFEWRKD